MPRRTARRATGSRRAVARTASTAVLIGAAVYPVWLLLPDEAVLSPAWTQVVGWPLTWLVRLEAVQRRLGGGRLDNRVWLRAVLGNLVLALVLAPTGLPFLVPVAATLVAGVHVSWSGARAGRPCVLVGLLATALVQVGVHLGLLPSVLPVAVSDVAAVVTAVLTSSLIVNTALLAARREEAATALDAERRAHHDELRHAATHDPLTGLLNRAGLHERLSDELTRTGPRGGTAVVYLDLDGFKPVNDRWGHRAGDALLRLVAQRLAGTLRPGDGLARVGGDEFVVVLTGVGGAGDVEAAAARVASSLRAPFTVGGALVRVGASTGTSLTRDPATAPEALLHEADVAMYAVKARRRRPAGPEVPTPSPP
ncbi:diguanylate cyclase domain-containing protein [Kineococcus sp. SYSU DK004]|uniref:diguanylate cyclase domain-containing protein n=1 Tax=Kineococcus sp. SYSU DK004 TaxID=3383125 RepID=UPI003D7EF567